MDSKEFKKFCKDEFAKYGFRKVKTCYYCQGNGVLCGLYLQHSDFGPMYYVNFYFFIGDFTGKEYPSRYDHDFRGRFAFMSKTSTIDGGKTFLGALVEYNYYSADELHQYFEKGFKEMICPVLEHGKDEIVLLLKQDKCHANLLREEETLNKLKD